jgi:hypothetical protein
MLVRGHRGRVAGMRPRARTAQASVTEKRRTLAHDLTALSSLFAPVTVVRALLLYVGWVRTRAFFTYFGIDAGMLGFGPQDYILRSGQVGLGAVVILAMVAGFLIALDRAISVLLDMSRRVSRWISTAVAIAGAGCVLIGLLQVLDYARVAAAPPNATFSPLVARSSFSVSVRPRSRVPECWARRPTSSGSSSSAWRSSRWPAEQASRRRGPGPQR